MPEHIADLAEHQAGFAHIAFKCAFPQILFQGKVDLRLIFFNACFQLGKGLYPAADMQGCARIKISTVFLYDFFDLCLCHDISSPFLIRMLTADLLL